MKKFLSIFALLLIGAIVLVGCDVKFQLPWEVIDDDEVEECIEGDEDCEEDDDKDADSEDDDVETGDLISFYNDPIVIAYDDFFMGNHLETFYSSFGGEELLYQNWGDDEGFYEWAAPDVFEVGEFNYGNYEGQTLYVIHYKWDGPMPRTLYRVAVDENDDWTLFTEYSNGWDEWAVETYGDLFENYDDMTIAQYELPNTVIDQDTGSEFKKIGRVFAKMSDDFLQKELFVDDEVGVVAMSKDTAHCIFASAPDGIVEFYDMIPPFLGETSPNEMMGHVRGHEVNITWDDGTKASETYAYLGTYPFMGKCMDVMNSEFTMNQIEVVGVTSNGDDIYEIAYYQHQLIKDTYNRFFGYMDESSEMYLTLEEYYNSHPLFFWIDPYDNIIQFENVRYAPVAEMGKPVIYLYPEEVTQVSVEVEPTHGISISDPEYGEGWDVVAYPNGELVNLDDGEIYPYLFWEGLSLDYVMPEEGFVVAQGDVESFLEESLAELGLNEDETADFMEFWYPRFEGAPYYFVTFMPQEDFEVLAPLTVSPAPETVIRVYMDFLPLAAPVDVIEPELSAPARDGFTVIEWGGALHK